MKHVSLIVVLAVALVTASASFAQQTQAPSGVNRATQKVQVDPTTGLTREQGNVKNRLLDDNKPGAVKHLYVISPKSGVVLLYSTVRGKVTSGGKRLTPLSTIEKYKCGSENKDTCYEGQRVIIGGAEHLTTEITQDDGTYGSSAPYLYWYDSQGRYHQHFFTEGQVIHISDQPVAYRTIIINADIAAAPEKR
jgi:hypothetical protein